jgi:hypothetical protein
MNIYQSLEKDHKEVAELLDKLIRSSEENNEEWKNTVEQIRDELIPHSRAEEAVFYNAIRELSPDNHAIKESYAEHAAAEMELRTLQAMKAVDINWTTLAKKLRADILHHVKHEESKVCTAARKLFTDEEAKMIGKAFKELKPIVREQSLIGTTVDLISNLLPRRLVPGFRKSVSKHEKHAA